MNRDKQINIINSIPIALEKQKKKEDADGITYQIDVDRYASKDRVEKEKEMIFKNYPIVVGAAGQLKKAGDYFLHDSSEMPIIVVKGKDKEIRALVNMCRHRGVRLLEEKEGHIKRNIVCPYHAWTYDTVGCLKSVLHPQGFNDVNADTHSLIELDCWVKMGLIFVLQNPACKEQFDMDKWFSEIGETIEGFDFGECFPFYHTSGVLRCNWKLLVDGGLEGYHFKVAHAKTIGQYFLDNLSMPTSNKLHSTVVFPKRAAKKMYEQQPPSDWKYRKATNTLLHIFPNTIVLIEPDHVMVVLFTPIDEKTTEYKSFMLLPAEPTTEKEREYWNLNGKIFWNAINEDNEMAELQQRTFNQFSDTSMTVGSYEPLLVQFENLVDAALRGENIFR